MSTEQGVEKRFLSGFYDQPSLRDYFNDVGIFMPGLFMGRSRSGGISGARDYLFFFLENFGSMIKVGVWLDWCALS